MSLRQVHPNFQLNGRPLKAFELLQLADQFIKNGEPYEEEVGHFIAAWLNEKQFVLVNTSGSTGDPKVIRLLKKHMVNSAKATGKQFKLPEGTTALLCLPSRYVAGKMMLVRAMVLGWRIDLVPPKSNPLDTVFKRYEFCAMTPFQLDNSIARLHLLSKLIVGGSPFSQSLKEKVQEVDTRIYETYGMTETITHIAMRRINSKKNSNENPPFKTLNKVTVSQDERGCLVIKAPKVSTDPIVTNDMVELLSYKKFLWLGRVDNVVNSGGIKLFPEQIERKLNPQIEQDFFVAGEPHETLGERLVLVIERDQDNITPVDFSSLDTYEIPKAVYFCPVFDRTETGKIKRDATLRLVAGY